ncbi:hypothetical protein C8R43DRAFT_974766 [Mycena crocata]|nr:hypothetical protein C8R43DRAFT_974766 [Mycena crocata]
MEEAMGTQELLDQFISPFSDSLVDLKTRALVSRSWAAVAQRCLFKTITIDGLRTCIWLKQDLPTTPHLIPHIRHLSMYPTEFVIQEACRFLFTHLESVFIFLIAIQDRQSAHELQRLLSLPSIRHVQLRCTDQHLSDFARIWKTCSPNLKHLALDCSQVAGGIASDQEESVRSLTISLESVQLGKTLGMRDWLTWDQCPFDFSALRGLTLYTEPEILRLPKITAGLQNIETLSFVATVRTQYS